MDKSPNPVQNAYNNVPKNQRGNGHGNCAEVCSLGNAINGNKHLKGAVSVALNVKDGKYLPGCGSCGNALESFGVLDAVKQNGKLKY